MASQMIKFTLVNCNTNHNGDEDHWGLYGNPIYYTNSEFPKDVVVDFQSFGQPCCVDELAKNKGENK